MDASSPVKRRVLGALDPNACSPNKARRHEGGKQQLFTPARHLSPVKVKSVAPRQELSVGGASPTTRVSSASPSSSPSPSPFSSLSSSQSLVPDTPERETGVESRKRRSPNPSAINPPTSGMAAAAEAEAAEGGEPAAKRACLDGMREDGQSPPSSTSTTRTTGTTRHRSASPDTPSVFDNSAVDNSQLTILTEPDATGPNPNPAPVPAPRARPRLTREQAREKAEILRLRLGLASYKVRTGQTDVPLDRLEARLAGDARHAGGSSASSFHGQTQAQGQSTHHGPTTSVAASFPPPGATAAAAAAQREHRRRLPGAPVRRASVGTERGHYSRPAPPSRSQLLEEVRLALARETEQGQDRQHDDRHQNRHDRYDHHHQLHHDYRYSHMASHQYQHHHHHQRRQSEALLDTRHDPERYRYASNPADRRPRTATDVPGSSLVSSSLSSSSSSSSSSAAAWLPSSSSRRRAASFAGNGGYLRKEENADENRRREEYEEDMDSRGGAASGLLSLARS
ncbi:hypothetical protein MYCTH_2303678 [Thermothelomyces thermophilus ATCC 42464]|uniref:Cyclin-dependent kinase n=1 Tax=Thermothelomyces thermophilus (strain ATCC 42464 / BCRC 31852 / DSM 1799) TaxID=573729 RepID=G2QDA1_THET4|nr:uncharacterized protein MYCTH_2303678 [Thermothelomyces thermophilus ATCC 42464]AEO57467.1 hypothetical protein MYCTH_2303678 [Thermothelomyces thermophilus ATCC 42464]